MESLTVRIECSPEKLDELKGAIAGLAKKYGVKLVDMYTMEELKKQLSSEGSDAQLG